MHELSLCRAIAGVVKPHAVGRQVNVVRVQVGAVRQVVPDSLSFCWALVRDVEDMPAAQLELELVQPEVSCRACVARSAIASRYSVACPGCGSADVEICRGQEILVTSAEIGDLDGVESSKGVQNG